MMNGKSKFTLKNDVFYFSHACYSYNAILSCKFTNYFTPTIHLHTHICTRAHTHTYSHSHLPQPESISFPFLYQRGVSGGFSPKADRVTHFNSAFCPSITVAAFRGCTKIGGAAVKIIACYCKHYFLIINFSQTSTTINVCL